MWVEYNPARSNAESVMFGVWDTLHNQKAFDESLQFTPFSSVVIALGGENQVPSDPPDPLHGTFQVARTLYQDGYDVHMYEKNAVVASCGAGVAYDEVLSAVRERGVSQVAIFGYSHGGGATYYLSHYLDFTTDIHPDFTSYVDAVEDDDNYDVQQETRRPIGTGYHMNQYQHGSAIDAWLDGGPVSGSDWELDVETTAWGANATHYTVDDYQEVRTEIQDQLRARISR